MSRARKKLFWKNRKQEQSPLCSIDGLFVTSHTPNWYQLSRKNKGRVVPRADIVKDDSGAYAVFTAELPSVSLVCELALGVYMFDLNSWIHLNVAKQPITCNSGGSGHMSHCRTPSFDYHFAWLLFYPRKYTTEIHPEMDVRLKEHASTDKLLNTSVSLRLGFGWLVRACSFWTSVSGYGMKSVCSCCSVKCNTSVTHPINPEQENHPFEIQHPME